MRHRACVVLVALCAAVSATMTGARAFDESRYPQWKGEWRRVPVAGLKGQPSHDPNKSEGLAQQAPLTPEYQAVLEASIADQAAGGPGNDPTYTCLAPGMPRVMIVYDPMEIIITPGTTHMLMGHIHDFPSHLHRRARLARRDRADLPGPFHRPLDRYQIRRPLRPARGRDPRVQGPARLRLHRPAAAPGQPDHHQGADFSDQADPNLLHDELTTIDHALTRPWTVTKTYRRQQTARPAWREVICAEGNQHVKIGREAYFLSADGYLMPTKKDQSPPDLKYFEAGPKVSTAATQTGTRRLGFPDMSEHPLGHPGPKRVEDALAEPGPIRGALSIVHGGSVPAFAGTTPTRASAIANDRLFPIMLSG